MLKRENVIKYVCISIVGAIFLFVFIIYNNSSKSTYMSDIPINEFVHESNLTLDDTNSDMHEVVNNIFVEIKGEVLRPNVYEMEDGSIVRDLIALSGGITENGDLSNINQARKLIDGECIVVYSKDQLKNIENIDVIDIGVFNDSLSNNSSSLININTATKEELKQLNGIGDTLADSIIAYRESNGRFKSIDDIKNVPRIGDKTFEKFMDKIKV